MTELIFGIAVEFSAKDDLWEYYWNIFIGQHIRILLFIFLYCELRDKTVHFFQCILFFIILFHVEKCIDCISLSCHVRVSEWIHTCLNVEDLLARSRREIWSLSDCNWTWTYNHLVRKRRLKHLAKLTGQLGQMVECSFTN